MTASIEWGFLLPALANVESGNIPGSELEKLFGIPHLGGQARGPPVKELNSENLGQQIGLSGLVCRGELHDERCAA